MEISVWTHDILQNVYFLSLYPLKGPRRNDTSVAMSTWHPEWFSKYNFSLKDLELLGKADSRCGTKKVGVPGRACSSQKQGIAQWLMGSW